MMLFLHKIGLAVPLLSYVAYQLINKEPHSSVTYALTGLNKPSYVPIHGYVEEGFEETLSVFRDNFLEGKDIGAGVSVYLDGKKVVSLQGGWKDIEKKIEYTNETLQMVFSSTKALTATVVAQLVDQGLLSYDERISTYWPEFAQGNKGDITVMDMMRHTAGVAGLDNPISLSDFKDPNVLSNILASQPHNFNGTRLLSYHAITQGWYINEIIRRVDPQHRTVDDFAQEFNRKYGIEWYLKPDVTEGLDISRISQFYPKSDLRKATELVISFLRPSGNRTYIRSVFSKSGMVEKILTNTVIDQVKGIVNNNDPPRRSIEGPAYSGHSNADSLAKLVAMLANKGKAIVPGEPDLFSEATYNEAMTFIAVEKDHTFPMTMINLRGGFRQFTPTELGLPEDGTFIGGVGTGGSVAIYSPIYNIAFGYVTNAYVTDGPSYVSKALIKSVYKAAKKIKQQKA